MAFAPSTFKTKLSSAGGGARPSLYKVAINYSVDNSFSVMGDDALLVKATALPGSTIAPLTVNYAGRAYKWQGFRTYDNWTVTVINDENFSIRNKMMEWMRWISGMLDGGRTTVFGDPSKPQGGYYDGNATVTQVGTDGTNKQNYKMYNLWPTELGEIAVDWSSDAIQEYTIGFAYDYWSSGTGTSTTDDLSPSF
jgi:hypothetical protein